MKDISEILDEGFSIEDEEILALFIEGVSKCLLFGHADLKIDTEKVYSINIATAWFDYYIFSSRV